MNHTSEQEYKYCALQNAPRSAVIPNTKILYTYKLYTYMQVWLCNLLN